jgi:capsular polysaccharide transport system ATP-binding protein
MITLNDIHKSYETRNGPNRVLRGISLTFPADCNVAVIGANGAGKSTLLRLIAGIDTPDRGSIDRQCRVSWPLGLAGGLQKMLTGRQNTRFICRIQGFDTDLDEKAEFVHKFSGLRGQFDEPLTSYSSGMRARLALSLSLAFDFDVYLIDELMAVGDARFRRKSRKAIADLANRSSLIMASHDDELLKTFCRAAVWLHEGQARWFDSVEEALALYNESDNESASESAAA